jgi:hypothetical protein
MHHSADRRDTRPGPIPLPARLAFPWPVPFGDPDSFLFPMVDFVYAW